MSEEQKLKHLIRVKNTDLKGDKNIVAAMKNIKGVGFSFATMVCNKINIDKNRKAGSLTEAEVAKIEDFLDNPESHNVPEWMLNRPREYATGETRHLCVAELAFAVQNDFRRLQKAKSFRGLRSTWGLPTRGQRTKSNFRRNKGKGMGVKRKK